MKDQKILNLFYEEPESDRWVRYDRYLRKFVRRLIRGKPRPGGQMMVAINLLKGLDKLNIPYRFNDYSYIKKHPEELACIIGKPFLLDKKKWKNPILFGASIFSHPLEDPNLISRHPQVKKILVPGQWMKHMFEDYYPGKVISWPVGIDTEQWSPNIKQQPEFDFIIYDKIRWDYDDLSQALLGKIQTILNSRGLKHTSIRYMFYKPEELKDKVGKSKYCIFLVEHETQGLAYQQILSTGTPIFAWEQEEFWKDPQYYPQKVKFGPVSAVPYWDERCGLKFRDAGEFEEKLDMFLNGKFNPRSYITENLTLEKQALQFVEIATSLINNAK